MNAKEEYRKAVETVKKQLKSAGKPSRNEDIANDLGYSRSYFSTLTGDTGKVTKDHIKTLYLTYPFLSENQTHQTKRDESQKDSYQDKYIALLERDRDLLENKIDRIEVNLDSVRNGQLGILMAIQVGLDEGAELKAAVLKTDPAGVKEAVNKKLKKGLKVGIQAD